MWKYGDKPQQWQGKSKNNSQLAVFWGCFLCVWVFSFLFIKKDGKISCMLVVSKYEVRTSIADMIM